MRCECCGTTIRQGEVVHGFKYGSIDGYNEVFMPAKDSAWSVICGPCGEMVYRLIYAKLNNVTKPIHPAISRRQYR